MMRSLVVCIAAAYLLVIVASRSARNAYNVQVSVMHPQGIRLRIRDNGQISMVAYHYSINKVLSGVAAGQWNVDVQTKTGDYWQHENTAAGLKSGDTVYYWAYIMTKSGSPVQILNQRWTVSAPTDNPSPSTTTTTRKPTASNTRQPAGSTSKLDPATRPPSSGGSSHPGPVPVTSVASVPSGQTHCTSYPCLVFEDNFDTLDFDKWQHEITAGGGGNWEFQYYDNNRENSYVRGGTLFLKPTLTEHTFGEKFVRTGSLNLWGASPANLCTGNAWFGCERNGHGNNIVNPVRSARLRTVNSFNFRYGKVEVEAKMPTGDWIWPAIWLLPANNEYGEWPRSGEIDMVEVRSNRNLRDGSGQSVGIDQMGTTLHWGPSFHHNSYARTHSTRRAKPGSDFGKEFHKYGLEWTDKWIKSFLDGQEIMHVEPPAGGFWELGEYDKIDESKRPFNPWSGGSRMAPFDKKFYIIMNVAVGGTAYFADGFHNSPTPKPWKNNSPHASYDFWIAKGQWYPTWNPRQSNGEDAAMQVKSVKVWQTKENLEA